MSSVLIDKKKLLGIKEKDWQKSVNNNCRDRENVSDTSEKNSWRRYLKKGGQKINERDWKWEIFKIDKNYKWDLGC